MGLLVGFRTMSKLPMVVSNRTTDWADTPPATHKQTATAMPNLEVMPLPEEVLPTAEEMFQPSP
jgi:hypothetical protein